MRLVTWLAVVYFVYQASQSLLVRVAFSWNDSHPDLDRVDAVLGLLSRVMEAVGLHRDLDKLTANDLDEINKERTKFRETLNLLGDSFAPKPLHDCWRQKTCIPRNVSIDAADGKRKVRGTVVQPLTKASGKKRLVVYFHAGGAVLGDAFNSPLAYALAHTLDAVVVSVEYRKSPESRYPAAVEDGYEMLLWAFENGQALGADISKMTLAGDSAGGMLTAATALMLKERKPELKVHQLIMIIPMLGPVLSRSYVKYENIHLLPLRQMGFFWDMYTTNVYDCVIDPLCSPVSAKIEQIKGIADRALVIPAKADVLHDEAIEFARKMELAGVKVTTVESRGTHIGVLLFDDLLSDERVLSALK